MQKIVKPLPRQVAEARRTLLALGRRVPTEQAAAETRIHQSQVSRLFRGQFKRISANVRTLLAYERGTRRGAAGRQPAPAREAVVREALRTWDTTPEGARALVRLLKSVREIREIRAGLRPRRARR